jgi:hypothetical protein
MLTRRPEVEKLPAFCQAITPVFFVCFLEIAVEPVGRLAVLSVHYQCVEEWPLMVAAKIAYLPCIEADHVVAKSERVFQFIVRNHALGLCGEHKIPKDVRKNSRIQ